MVAGGLLEQPDTAIDRAGLGIVGSVIEAAQPHMSDGARAHGAGLERYIEIATIEPPGAANSQRRADGQHFGVGGRIVQLTHAVALRCEYLPVFDEYRPDRRLAMRRRLGRKAESHIHVGRSGVRHHLLS